MALLRNLDLVILALALPVFVLADLPLAGYATALVIWLMWRGIGILADRKAEASNELRSVAGIEMGSMIARGWLMALILFGAGLAGGDDVGLSAAVLCVVLFTVSFTARMAIRPFDGPRATTP